jgi:hypothetical protein
MVKLAVTLIKGSESAKFEVHGDTMPQATKAVWVVARRDYAGFKVVSITKV